MKKTKEMLCPGCQSDGMDEVMLITEFDMGERRIFKCHYCGLMKESE